MIGESAISPLRIQYISAQSLETTVKKHELA